MSVLHTTVTPGPCPWGCIPSVRIETVESGTQFPDGQRYVVWCRHAKIHGDTYLIARHNDAAVLWNDREPRVTPEPADSEIIIHELEENLARTIYNRDANPIDFDDVELEVEQEYCAYARDVIHTVAACLKTTTILRGGALPEPRTALGYEAALLRGLERLAGEKA